MSWDLSNKVVVITGGAQGIGFAIADKYLKNGAKTIIILDINEKLGFEAAKKLTEKYGDNRAVFYKCDVTTDVEEVSKKIFNNFTVDVLVNNAGILNEAVPKKCIDLNVTGLIEWSYKFWEHMKKDKGGNGGTIVNIGSLSCFRIDRFFSTYQASKFALMGFTRSLGHEANFKRSGVRVIALCPGPTRTNMLSIMITRDDTPSEDLENTVKSVVWQTSDVVGDAAVEVYLKAESGSAWLIEAPNPLVEINN